MSKRYRFLLVLVMAIIAVAFLLPTIRWYWIVTAEEKALATSSRFEIREYALRKASDKIKEIKALIARDAGAPLPDDLQFLAAKIKERYRVEHKSAPKVFTVKDLADTYQEGEVIEALTKRYREEIENVKDIRSRIITLGLDLQGGMRVSLRADFPALEQVKGRSLSTKEKDDAVRGVLEVLTNRIDQFGVSEPVIRREGGPNSERILVEMPGAADPERIRRVIVGKGRLAFHIADQEGLAKLIQYQQTHPGPYLAADGTTIVDEALRALLGESVILRRVVEKDSFGIDQPVGYAVLTARPGLEGERVQEAFVRMDPLTNHPEVIFRLDGTGGDIFYKLTSENRGKRLAVLLDNNVKAQATIQDAIRQDVRVTGFGTSEATDLALVLKTGSLPVPVDINSQEAVGASLGEDAIRHGGLALLTAVGLVVAFMTFYYRGPGIIASFALLVNMFLMVSVLSVFNFTLTLPGIAGFILNLGMSVDANVIIYERMKDEQRLGKSRSSCIEGGFHKAFWAIVDGQITTFIAAISLAQFGSGPIKGFATVLAVGIITTLIAALFVSRLVFDFVTDVFKANKLTISWRRAS
jgi:preprotein translocase subunit SecD